MYTNRKEKKILEDHCLGSALIGFNLYRFCMILLAWFDILIGISIGVGDGDVAVN